MNNAYGEELRSLKEENRRLMEELHLEKEETQKTKEELRSLREKIQTMCEISKDQAQKAQIRYEEYLRSRKEEDEKRTRNPPRDFRAEMEALKKKSGI